MQGYSVLFPIVSGWVVTKLLAGLAASSELYATDVQIGTDRPTVMPARFVQLRDDSGPSEMNQKRSRFGVNVYAADRVDTGSLVRTDATNLALLCMAILSGAADGQPVTAIDQLSGPFQVDDEPQLTESNQLLGHRYFTFRVTARGTNF